MCGQVNTPSLVGREVTITRTPRVGSFYGPLKVGVRLRIDSEHQLEQRHVEAFSGLDPDSPVPDQFLSATMIANPAGESLESVPLDLRNDVALFRDEFDLVERRTGRARVTGDTGLMQHEATDQVGVVRGYSDAGNAVFFPDNDARAGAPWYVAPQDLEFLD